MAILILLIQWLGKRWSKDSCWQIFFWKINTEKNYPNSFLWDKLPKNKKPTTRLLYKTQVSFEKYIWLIRDDKRWNDSSWIILLLNTKQVTKQYNEMNAVALIVQSELKLCPIVFMNCLRCKDSFKYYTIRWAIDHLSLSAPRDVTRS